MKCPPMVYICPNCGKEYVITAKAGLFGVKYFDKNGNKMKSKGSAVLCPECGITLVPKTTKN